MSHYILNRTSVSAAFTDCILCSKVNKISFCSLHADARARTHPHTYTNKQSSDAIRSEPKDPAQILWRQLYTPPSPALAIRAQPVLKANAHSWPLKAELRSLATRCMPPLSVYAARTAAGEGEAPPATFGHSDGTAVTRASC